MHIIYLLLINDKYNLHTMHHNNIKQQINLDNNKRLSFVNTLVVIIEMKQQGSMNSNKYDWINL